MTVDRAQLAALHAVVTEGSFEAAARALHVTPSAVSQRIKALEQAAGQVLVRRARPCAPTEAGRALFRLAGQVSLLEQEALAAARGPLAGDAEPGPQAGDTVTPGGSAAPGSPGGSAAAPVARTRIPVAVNADSLATWFLGALARLPTDRGFCFDLVQDDQDHTAALLRDGSVLAGVTAQRAAVQGCRSQSLGAMRYLALAAPALLARHPAAGADPVTALAELPMLVFNRKDELQHRFLAGLTRRRLEPPVHHVPSASAFLDAIRLGLGWGMAPEQMAAADVAAGRCVPLLPDRPVDVPLYWQSWRLESTTLAALTAAVVSEAATALR